jgi:YebC/PmpR family DNA-binding regulatory protein
MSRDQIDRALKRGTGELEGAAYEEVTYEGYGPHGVAMIVECLTDNRNRTASDVRTAFSKGGGNLAATGAVAFTFARKGSIHVKRGPTEEQVMNVALEAGADDVLPSPDDEGGGFEVRTEPHGLHAATDALEKAGFALGESKLTYVPANTVKLEGAAARGVLQLIDQLEDHDDVQHVYANLEVDEATLQSLS